MNILHTQVTMGNTNHAKRFAGACTYLEFGYADFFTHNNKANQF